MKQIGYNTCKRIYNNLGLENGRTAIRQMQGMIKQGLSPKISKLEKDVIEFKFATPASDITQNFNYANRVLTQNAEWGGYELYGKIHSGHELDIISF